jgi:tetrahydromethanopterin S-methyltransferase subunit G
MKKAISILVVFVLALSLSYANYSSNQTQKNINNSEKSNISNIINSINSSLKVTDFKDNLKNLQSKITQKVKEVKGNIVEKIKNSTGIHKFIIIGLICLLIGALLGSFLKPFAYILSVIGIVFIILGLIAYL